jgi:hypothetical protein
MLVGLLCSSAYLHSHWHGPMSMAISREHRRALTTYMLPPHPPCLQCACFPRNSPQHTAAVLTHRGRNRKLRARYRNRLYCTSRVGVPFLSSAPSSSETCDSLIAISTTGITPRSGPSPSSMSCLRLRRACGTQAKPVLLSMLGRGNRQAQRARLARRCSVMGLARLEALVLHRYPRPCQGTCSCSARVC